MFGGEKSKESGKEGAMKWPGYRLSLLSLPANRGRLTFELVTEGDEWGLGRNKLGGVGGPCRPTMTKGSKN
jgi:hypothetical protein